MRPEDLEQSDFQALARLMGGALDPAWRLDELESILRHQLSAPLSADLGTELLEVDAALATSDRCKDFRRLTFGELLFGERPPEEGLRLVKDFAKAQRSDPLPLIPPEVATVLYYAAIVVGSLRLGALITNLRRETVQEGIDWALEQVWVVERLRALFLEAREYL